MTMGTTDKTTHNFSCPSCEAKDTITVLEKGSMWGASWNIPPVSELFNVEWKRGQFGEPEPISIKCKTCGIDAQQR
jgi:hypothetical protein